MSLFDVFRRKKRSYPWLFEAREIRGLLHHQCEACTRRAVMSVHYELSERSELSSMFLCGAHFVAVRAGGWHRVFSDINAKIKKGEK